MISYILDLVIRNFTLLLIWFVVVMSGINFLQMILALFYVPAYFAKKQSYESSLLGVSGNMLPFSLLVPAYNEEEKVIDSIKSMLN